MDREKYPQAEQKFRFEKTEPGCGNEAEPEQGTREKTLVQSRRNCGLAGRGVVSAERDGGWGFSPIEPVPDQPNPLLIEFLDAESTEEQLAVLRRMEGCVGKRELDSVCVYLDISTRYGSLEEQTEGIRRYLKLQMHYDASRLRRGKRDDSSCFI